MTAAAYAYRLCPVCEKLVETYAPGESYVKVHGALYHPDCALDSDAPMDEDERDDLLERRFRKSIQVSCKHAREEIASTSESGSNTCYVGYYCRDCKRSRTEEVTPAEYARIIAESEELSDLDALKQSRHAEDPTCQVCKLKVETIGEASLLTNVLYATRGDRTVYAHTKCLGLAFTQIANRAVRMRNVK